MRGFRLTVLIGAAIASATPAVAQNALPGLENFTLERPQPPTPRPSATPSATPSAVPTPVPVVTATPTAPARTVTATPTAAAIPRPTPTARIVAAPTPANPQATAPPAPLPSATAIPASRPTEPPPEPANSWTLWLAVASALAAAVAGIVWWRSRGNKALTGATPLRDEVIPAPEPELLLDTPLASAPARPVGGLVTSALKPVLEFELRPRRGGADSLRATLEYDLIVANEGRSPAYEIAVEAWLLSASAGQDADLDYLFALTPGDPMVPRFALAPATSIALTGTVTGSRDSLAVISVDARRLFVPLFAVRAGFRDSRGTARSASTAFMVGIARAGAERLAPLPLDRGAQLREGLAARRYVTE